MIIPIHKFRHQLGLIFSLIAISAHSQNKTFSIAFGSCDNQRLKNELWKSIDENHPVAWIWGGDDVYSDTEDMNELKENYDIQKNDSDYLQFIANKQILGTWDDHDYGLNDGGEEYPYKRDSQQLLLDFLGTPKDAPERFRDGVYNAKVIDVEGNKVKVIVLDSRFFRTAVTKAVNSKKRLQPNPYGQGTILGEAQWKWLEEELTSSDAQFNVIVSSIQLLSDKNGFECWGNFPHEIDKLENMIVASKAKGTFIISGDRHIATFSSKTIPNLSYPLVDFTSSGLTHVFSNFSGEENPYQIGQVVAEKNFGLLQFDFKNNRVIMQIRGLENTLLGEHIQQY
jgi:alkaline phosphatase D